MQVTKQSKLDTLDFLQKLLLKDLRVMEEGTDEHKFNLWLQKNVIHMKVQVMHE